MTELLLADIGGSKSRFALANPAGRPERIRIIDNNTAADLETAVARYLAETGTRPLGAILAVAAPIDGDEVVLTNRAWRFRRSELAARLGLSRLLVVNDFEAIAWAVPELGSGETRLLGPALLPRGGTKVVLGPGTGLGVAALVQDGERWRALPSEGGHASFGPQSADEVELFARLRENDAIVSAERVLSGPGLARLARASGLGDCAPEAILERAHAGEPTATAVAVLFVRLLGRFAGSLALTFKATGGVYLTGGVGLGLGTLLEHPQFRAAFEAHPPYETLLRSIPTVLMICEQPGLIGCAALASRLATAPA